MGLTKTNLDQRWIIFRFLIASAVAMLCNITAPPVGRASDTQADSTADANQLYSQGLSLRSRTASTENAVEGLRLLERAAALGNANAALAAAGAYATGDRVEKDGQKAMNLLENGALRGNAFALTWKAWLWQNGWSPSQTSQNQVRSQIQELLTKRPAGKDFDQISSLRSQIEEKINLNTAADLYRQAIAVNYIQFSAVSLGILELLGSGSSSDPHKTFIAHPETGFGLLDRPAKEGNSVALFFRAFALERGIGVQRDVAAAREIYARPEMKNDNRAQIALRRTESSVSRILADENKDLSALIDTSRAAGPEPPDYTRGLSDFSIIYKAMTDFQVFELENRDGQKVFWAQLRKGESVALNPQAPEIIYLANISQKAVVGIIRNGQAEREVHNTESSSDLQVDPVDLLNIPTAASRPNQDSDWTLETPFSLRGVILHDPAYSWASWAKRNNGSHPFAQFAADKDHASDDYEEPYALPSGPEVIVRIRGSTRFLLRFQGKPVFEGRVPSGRVLILEIVTARPGGLWSSLDIPADAGFPSELDSAGDIHGIPAIHADGGTVGWLFDAYDPKQDGIIAEFVPGAFEAFLTTALYVKRDYKAASRLAKAMILIDLVSGGRNSPNLAAHRINLGQALAAEGDDQAAVNEFESGLNIWSSIASPLSVKQLPGLVATFRFFNARGEADRAALALYQALAISAAVPLDPALTKDGAGPTLIERVPPQYLSMAAEFLGRARQFERQRAYLFELTAREVSTNPYGDILKAVYNYVSLAEVELQSGGDAKPFLAVAHPYALSDSFVWKVWNQPEPLPNPYPIPAGVGFAGEWAKSELYAGSAETLGEVYFMEGRYPECANAMLAAVNIYLAAGSSALRAAAWDAICENNAGNLAKAQATLLAAAGWNATPGSPRRLSAGTLPDTISLVYDAWLGLVQRRENSGDLSPTEAGAEQFQVFDAADRDETARAEEIALTESGPAGLDPDLISSWRKARARLYSLDRQLASSTVFQPLTLSSATAAASFRREREEARSDFERLEQMVTAKLEKSATGGPRSLENAAQLQSQLAADEVAIDILPLRFGLGLLAVAKDRIDYRYVPIAERRLDALIARYRAALDPTSRGSAAFDPAPLLAVGKLTLEPLRDSIQGKNRLTLIPHGGFQSIPLEALRLDAGLGSPPTEASDSVRYLGLEHEITYAPSIASLWLSRTAAPTMTAGRPPFVGIGDPVIGHPELRQRIAGVWDSYFSWRGGGLDFSTLPETRDEIFRMRAIFGGAVRDTFLAADATKQSLLNSEDLRSSRVIDFATHGVTAGKFGSAVVDQPFLLLSPSGADASDDADTRLRMSDVISMNLQADLVILSACDTAASDGSLGSLGLSGLARAFLVAGARNVLVSHWEVESRAAYYFVTQFAENLVSKHMTYAAALLAARRSIAIDRGLSDPSYWSAFILLGDGNAQFVH